MRHTTAKKIQHHAAEHAAKPAQIFDFAELSRIQIATQAEIASHVAGNAEAPDFEAFLSQYGNGIASDFA